MNIRLVKKSLLLKLFFIAFIFFVSACKESNPVEDDASNSKSRKYTWKVDTVHIEMSMLSSLWGKSDGDVWIVGNTASLANTIWHEIMGQWTCEFGWRNVAPVTIFGFSDKDIWIAGEELTIWHYNGVWSQAADFDIPGHNFSFITDVWGDSPNDVYAVGFADSSNSRLSLMFHYDGKEWSRVNIPEMHYQFSTIVRGKKDSDNYFILANHIDLVKSVSDTTYVFEYDKKDFKPVLTGDFRHDETVTGISEIDGLVYMQKGSRIYQYWNNKLNVFLDRIPDNYGFRIWGRNENDIFITMKDGIAHYNGKDIQYVYRYNQLVYVKDTICFENSVYILAYDYSISENIVIKGYFN